MFQQFFAGRSLGKYPVVQLESEELASEISFKHAALAPLEKHFFRSEIVQQLVYIVECTFGCHKLARRDIKECHAARRFTEMNGGKEVIFFIRKNVIADSYPRSHQLGNPSLYQLFRGLRVFQLVADGNTTSCPYQFGQIGVKRVMWKTRHFYGLPLPIGTFGQRNAQNLGSRYSIFRIGFVEVTAPEQHDCVRVFCLQVEVLFHHGGQYHLIILCHS